MSFLFSSFAPGKPGAPPVHTPGRLPLGRSLRQRLARRQHTQRNLREHLARPLERFVVGGIVLVLLVVALDVVVQHLWPQASVWTELALHLGVLGPLLTLGGWYFARQTLRRERALLRRDARNWRQSERDPLTRTASRMALVGRIDELSVLCPQETATLLVLDLHDFQRVNDACGHEVGDRVLREVAGRLRALVSGLSPWPPAPPGPCAGLDHPILARVGADEFALWVPRLQREHEVSQLAQRMLGALEPVFHLGTQELLLRGCVGHVCEPLSGRRGVDWLTRANTAVQQAKRRGVGSVMAFSPGQQDIMVRRHWVQQDLRFELQQGKGLSLQFQPIAEVGTQRLLGCEVLLRWNHPYLGAVTPAEFVTVAEGCDLIQPLGRWVLDRALAQLAQWRRQVHRAPDAHFKLCVNLSRLQLQDPDLPAHVQHALHTHGIEPQALELEVTETFPLDDDETVSALRRLRQLGISLALDDFGTGYSSLSALLKLPLHNVKIDRQFIHLIDQFPHRRALVAGVVRTAGLMGLSTTAEGIERPEEAQVLAELGCQRMQGWLIGRPCDAQPFAQQWLGAPVKAAPHEHPTEAPAGALPVWDRYPSMA